MDILGTTDIRKLSANDNQVLMHKEVGEIFIKNQREGNIQYKQNNDGVFDVINFEPEIISDITSDYITVSFSAPPIFPFNDQSYMYIINSLVSIASQIHRIALDRKMLIRGAVTKEPVENYTKEKFMAGKMESEAVFPRVIIAKDIADLFIKHVSPTLMKKEEDGFYFINYLAHPSFTRSVEINDKLLIELLKIRSAIADGMSLTDNRDPRVKEKWRWLAKKFNESLDYFMHTFESIKFELATIKKFDVQ